MGFGGNRIRSLPDAVAKVLAMHYGLETNGKAKTKDLKLISQQDQRPLLQPQEEMRMEGFLDICPSCGEVSLVSQEGCKKCYSCGHSEC